MESGGAAEEGPNTLRPWKKCRDGEKRAKLTLALPRRCPVRGCGLPGVSWVLFPPSRGFPSWAGSGPRVLLVSTGQPLAFGTACPSLPSWQGTSAPCRGALGDKAAQKGWGQREKVFSQLSCRYQLHQNRAVVQRHFVSTDIISARFFLFFSTAGSCPGKWGGKGRGVAAERGC